MRRLFLLSALALTTPSLLQAQSYEFRFLAKGTGTALRKVELVGAAGDCSSDPKGEMRCEVTASEVTTSKVGYEVLKISVEELSTTEPNVFRLIPSQPADDEVIIEGKRKKGVSEKRVSIDEAKAVAPRGDPSQITKLLPGVQVAGFRPDVVIRGSEPGDSRYMVDGIEVPFIYHSIGGISVLSEQLLDSVDFSAGGFGAKYGEATGGLIVLKTKDEIPERRSGQVRVNVPVYSGVYFDEPLSEDSSISASFRRSYIDAILRRVLTEETIVLPVFYDAHVRMISRSGRDTTKTLLMTSYDGLEASFAGEGGDDGSLAFDLSSAYTTLGVEIKRGLSENWSLTTTPQALYVKNRINVIDNYVRIQGPIYKLPAEFGRKLEGGEELRVGFEAGRETVRVSVRAPDVKEEDPFMDFEEAQQIETHVNYQVNRYASWLAYDWKPASALVVTPSLRVSYTSQMQESAVDPRLETRYVLSDSDTLKAATGLYSKSPEPQETDRVFGNPDLHHEHVAHYIVGWEHKLSDLWSIDTEAYLKRGYSIVRPATIERYNNDGQRRSYGAEFFLRRNRTERAFGWLSYSYSKTQDRRAASQAWEAVQVDQTHVLNLVAGYSFSGAWSMGGRLLYHTGDRYTPVSGAVYNTGLGKYQPRYEESDRFGARLPDYYQIDLFNVYDFLKDNWKLKLRTGIEYLAFSRPAFGVTYNYDYSKKEYFRGVPPIPYIELTGEF